MSPTLMSPPHLMFTFIISLTTVNRLYCIFSLSLLPDKYLRSRSGHLFLSPVLGHTLEHAIFSKTNKKLAKNKRMHTLK